MIIACKPKILTIEIWFYLQIAKEISLSIHWEQEHVEQVVCIYNFVNFYLNIHEESEIMSVTVYDIEIHDQRIWNVQREPVQYKVHC